MTAPLLRKSPFRTARPLFATCDAGLEAPLQAELQAMGITEFYPDHRGVGFMGTPAQMWRVNLESRIANRVLLPIAEFPAATPDELYEGVKRIDWSAWMQVSQSIAVDASTHRSQMENTAYIAMKAKDAICDAFREMTNRRPNVERETPDIRINAHIEDDHCIISLDSSGERLHRRGYRLQTGDAPIKETLAAAILAFSGYDGTRPLVDPMCGSGTFAIEAALIARNVAPGLMRLREDGPGFAFQRWHGFDARAFEEVVEDAYERIRPADQCPSIYARDIDPNVIEKAKKNAARAGVDKHITFEVGRLSEVQPLAPNGLFVVNPPYGHRLGEGRTLGGLYKTLGMVLKQRFTGYRAAIIASQDAPYKNIRLETSLRQPMRNGSIDCMLLGFELYEGTRRKIREPKENLENEQTAESEIAAVEDEKIETEVAELKAEVAEISSETQKEVAAEPEAAPSADEKPKATKKSARKPSDKPARKPSDKPRTHKNDEK